MDPLEQIRSEGEQLAGGDGQARVDVETEAERKAREQAAQGDADKKEAAQWAGIPYVFGAIVGEAMPELRPVYSEERCMDWGEKMLPVARHYGWNVGVFGLWAGLLAASWQMIKPTASAVIQRRKAAEEAEKTRDGKKGDQAAATTAAAGDSKPAAP